MLVRFIESRFDCAQASAACSAVCLEHLDFARPGTGNSLCLKCAEMCEATYRILTEDNEKDALGLRSQLELCAGLCVACAQEADRREGRNEGGRAVARSCRRCARDCAKLLDLLDASGG